MKIFSLLLRAFVFLLLLGFAIKNDGLVTVRAYFDTSWQMPLVLLILAMFALGMLAGVLAMLASSLGPRRELERLRKLLPSSSTRSPVQSDDADA
ncbi:LapA family protein [Uliginosibacterium aquaticum]|uniref:LapA family protein n=1 Tax=Uliginosibacterium aquaticum TaxID=2731212 RepID=A0ABX2IE73_9RHOO|nr:LapA family protein [Uliginosibacterium aquaticum]NSL54662.1 LapA family protein [Uliginosibacterium aquaticum]